MSGLLQNLIARHQGRALTVEPRQRALFEPDAGASERPVESQTVTTETPQPAAAEHNVGAAAATPSVMDFSMPSVQPPKTTADEPPPIGPVADRPERAPFDARIEEMLARIAMLRPSAPPLSRDDVRPVAEPPDVERLEAMIDGLANRTVVSEPAAPNVGDVARPLAASVPPDTRPFEPLRRDEANMRPAEPVLAAVPLAPANPEQSGLLQVPPWLRELQAHLGQQTEDKTPNSATEPVINVTIGRIEIRATKAESAPAAVKPSKPSGLVSLDDYLQQRNPRGRS